LDEAFYEDMQQQEVIEQTVEFVKETLAEAEGAHDWWHVYRVWKLAAHIGKEEDADLFVVQLAALLHDIADWKFCEDCDDDVGPQKAREWLESLKIPDAITQHVCAIIKGMSFKGAKVKSAMDTKEGRVVQDADRLDAIGAIGIGRTFAYGGSKGREMYNPDIKPEMHESFEQYKSSKSPTINHFYEKLLLLKDRMNTVTGQRLAEKRHEFMQRYLDEFYNEWEGES